MKEMMTYFVFLRGVNVSGKNLIKMDELRSHLSGEGFQDVISYIQSGNLIFRAESSPEEKLEQRISQMINDHFRIAVPVFVVNKDELKRVTDENPFLSQESKSDEFLHLTFLRDAVSPAHENTRTELLEEGEEKAIITGKYVYLHLPEGYGNARFTNTFFEKNFKTVATTRNWKTIKKMLSLIR